MSAQIRASLIVETMSPGAMLLLRRQATTRVGQDERDEHIVTILSLDEYGTNRQKGRGAVATTVFSKKGCYARVPIP